MALPFDKKFNNSSNCETCCNTSTHWWTEPPKDSLLVSYFRENGMHGLKYVAEPHRHLSERICWLIAFLIGVGAAAYLINAVWENYKKNPVIVSFQPTETDIGDIPFPAVTLCNMNRFPKSLFDRLVSESQDRKMPWSKRQDARERLQYLKSICGSQRSFAQEFDFAFHRGEIPLPGDDTAVLNNSQTSSELNTLLMEETFLCGDLLRLCMWSQEKMNCSEIFKPVITEFGKCCTFNILPIPLLLTNLTRTRFNESEGVISSKTGRPIIPRWNKTETNLWDKWEYTKGFTLDPTLKRPYRQVRAGVPYGLSILVDPDIDEYFCPSTDSEGFRLALHTALEMPPVQNLGVPIGVGKEIFLDIKVDMTVADPIIAEFPHEKRNCFFPWEKKLDFFAPYTTSNCMEECIAKITAESCSCTLFYMPRNEFTRVCSSAHDSEDYKCAISAKEQFAKDYRNTCKNCDSLCTDMEYHFESTEADLQSGDILWNDPENGEIPEWADHQMSIVHIYFGSDAFVPQVRSELYATVDLIANTGGLLGLCLGFSALSAVEIIYFFSLRWYWQRVRRREIGRKIAMKFVDSLKKGRRRERLSLLEGRVVEEDGYNNFNARKFGEKNENRVSRVDRNILPVYPAYDFNGSSNLLYGQRQRLRQDRY
ncbi:unnamed protein product [Allacma fusca]|uniref:Pickpocket protein 28 n=1 Tax=Allacma fusca TaxID=39272 RepID=A0A8J2JN64_9HEXA|nr:unnamed protein product [Allacma fusca]